MEKHNEMESLLIEDYCQQQEELKAVAELEIEDYCQQQKEQEAMIKAEIEQQKAQEAMTEAEIGYNIEQQKEQEAIYIAGLTKEEIEQNTHQFQKNTLRNKENEAKEDKRN